MFKALSDPTRLRLIKMMSDVNRAMCVNALTRVLDISQSAVSQHLRILKQAGLVQPDRRGNFIHYSLNNATVEMFREKLLNTEGEDFLVINNSGLFRFGSNFWSNNSKVTMLENQLEGLKAKTAEIENLIQEMKK
ncbi:MAG: winged helix-turn-helix transcriptional regulator [Proteobacteria bacterium]|nr:winged helix-turn-helix transcriptional regulator [Pseudomonadota bacterium]